ncbi:MAG: tripartite tricarboxylate transporter permease [Deltaproteobacteria bacterium]|nr:tripartite tricarboxylate transporter permease [Deltaproteobacteria bacterium]
MDFAQNLVYGFSVAISPVNIFFCFLGALLGTLIGVLPGLGPAAAIALLLPVTFKIPATASIIMLAGILYGAMYGGSTTSILVNIPGESASVVTCFDGYQMSKKGRAGPALGIAAFGSFIAGTFSTIMIMLLAPLLVRAALKFGPPEFVGLMLLGLTMVAFLSEESLLVALMMTLIGLLLGTIGIDPVVGNQRFTFGILSLMTGIEIIPLVMGIFGISEVLMNLEQTQEFEIFKGKIKGLLPTRTDWQDSAKPIARGTVIGFFLGIIPGVGAIIPTFISYALEKRLSKHPDKFGTGVIEGVAGPESTNNSASMGGFIPLLTLGLPTTGIMAMFLGALVIHGVQPGPLLVKQHPDLFWGVIASMYIGNFMLLILNLPLIGIWVQFLRIPYWILFPLIILFCLVGSYSVNGNYVDIILLMIFGGVGYLMRKAKFPGGPLILGFILGPMIEEALRQTLILSDGEFAIFFSRPICLSLIVINLLLLLSTPIKELLLKRIMT